MKLKSVIAILIWLSMSSPLPAQPYIPLVLNDATWIMFTFNDDMAYYSYYAHRIEGDTVVSGITYSKLYDYSLSWLIDTTFEIQTKQLSALLREDTTTQQVYAILYNNYGSSMCNFNPPEEVLLYDFNLHPGDSLLDCRVASLSDQERYPVLTVEYQMLYGAMRRVWTTETGDLIEGVGYVFGLLNLPHGIFHASHGTWLVSYCLGTGFECGLYTSTTGSMKPNITSVFPNPTERLLWPQISTHQASIIVWDMQGMPVIQAVIFAGQSLDVSGLTAGMYFLQIDESDSVSIAKFIKY